MSVVDSTGGQGSNWGIFNPLSPEFKQAETIFYELKDWQKTLVVIASIAGGLFFIIGAFPVFCWTVHAIKPGQDTTTDKINETVKVASGGKMPISPSTNTLPSSIPVSDPTKPPVPNSVSPLKSPKKFQNQAISHTIPPTAEEITTSQAFLEKVSQKHKSLFEKEGNPIKLYHAFEVLKDEFGPGINSVVWPHSHQLSNPILDCQDDEDAYFLPMNSLENAWSPWGTCINPSNLVEITFLKKTLQAAFTVGKKLVVVCLGNNIHAVAAGFSADGQFKVIDSMSGHAIDVNTLAKQLNQAALKNSKGESISFKGEYINTHVQKGGHECIRFATLYCYQMFKRKSLDAFKEVNGAFAEGKLKQYEDYKNINGSKKIRSLSKCNGTIYKDFMRSWAYRTQGIEQNTWEEIPIQMLQQRKHFSSETIEVYCLQKNLNLPPRYIDVPANLTFVNAAGDQVSANNFATMPQEQEIPLEDILANTFGSLTSPDEKRLLVFEIGNPIPRLYRWLPNQQIFTTQWDFTTQTYPAVDVQRFLDS